MCGLFGAIGVGINPHILRGLAIVNRHRGTDALGFFNSHSDSIKIAMDPLLALTKEDFSNWLDKQHKKSWFVCGHTRMGTRGSKTETKCAHPFRYGKYIGSHNGVVQAPFSYDVDSQWLIDLLNQHEGDYHKAFKDVHGTWALTWTDGEHLYLQSCGNPITAVILGTCVYYSSDEDHLISCTGHTKKIWEFRDGETWKYTFNRQTNSADVEVLKKFPYQNRSYVVVSSYGGQHQSYESGDYRNNWNWANRAGIGSDSCGSGVKDNSGSCGEGSSQKPVEGLTLSKKESKRIRKAARKQGFDIVTTEEELLWLEIERLEEEERTATALQKGEQLQPRDEPRLAQLEDLSEAGKDLMAGMDEAVRIEIVD